MQKSKKMAYVTLEKGLSLDDFSPEQQQQFHLMNVEGDFSRKLKEIGSVYKYISKWKLQQLWAYDQLESGIIREIMEIKFPRLIWLSLSNNSLGSIEPINRLYMPQLEGVYLSSNQLTRIRGLRKCHWPNLKKLGLCQNLIGDLECISQLLLAKSSEYIHIEIDEREECQWEDCRGLFKFQPTLCQKLRLASKNRIEITLPMIQKLSQKYPSLFRQNGMGRLTVYL